jgi:hypothetical protein
MRNQEEVCGEATRLSIRRIAAISIKLTMNGQSRRMYLTGIGVHPIVVVPASNPAARVSAARMILPKSWFDAEGCAVGIKLLRAYRRQWNEKMGVWGAEPVRDAATQTIRPIEDATYLPTAAFWASKPRPLRPCCSLETR